MKMKHILFALLIVTSTSAFAEECPNLAGNYKGTIFFPDQAPRKVSVSIEQKGCLWIKRTINNDVVHFMVDEGKAWPTIVGGKGALPYQDTSAIWADGNLEVTDTLYNMENGKRTTVKLSRECVYTEAAGHISVICRLFDGDNRLNQQSSMFWERKS